MNSVHTGRYEASWIEHEWHTKQRVGVATVYICASSKSDRPPLTFSLSNYRFNLLIRFLWLLLIVDGNKRTAYSNYYIYLQSKRRVCLFVCVRLSSIYPNVCMCVSQSIARFESCRLVSTRTHERNRERGLCLA